jgi:uncharacterized membrane protein
MDDTGRRWSIIAIIAVTAITVVTSVEHHRTIASVYGDIANIFVPLIAVSSFALGAAIALVFQWGITVIQFEQVAKLLPAHEKAVLSLLFDRRKMTQEELAAHTGLSRLAVSRITNRLEEKGIATKKPLGNTNIIESKIYRLHPTTQVVTRLPGLSEERMILAIAVVLLFGLSISVLNSFHILVINHPLEPSLYLLAIEFLAIGGLANLLLRKRIAAAQFERTLGILPEDERDVLKTVYNRKAITQSELVQSTGIYKMKVSRIIDKLHQKGLVDKKPQGYTNLIISRIS